jgi:hypothetical protein
MSIAPLGLEYFAKYPPTNWTSSSFTSTMFDIPIVPLGSQHFSHVTSQQRSTRGKKDPRFQTLTNILQGSNAPLAGRWFRTEACHWPKAGENEHSSGVQTSGKALYGSAHLLPQSAGEPVTAHTVGEKVVQGDHIAV